jgi:hypothetical protein
MYFFFFFFFYVGYGIGCYLSSEPFIGRLILANHFVSENTRTNNEVEGE